MLYVADVSQACVAQMKLSDTTLMPKGQILQVPRDTVTSLAVDWITHNLYWSSSKKPQIYVTSANGKFTSMILQAGIQDTTSIALHPPTGRMCFTTLGSSGNDALPQVDCATMDGRNQILLWKNTQVPNFLSFSSQGTTVYWADIGKCKPRKAAVLQFLPHLQQFMNYYPRPSWPALAVLPSMVELGLFMT